MSHMARSIRRRPFVVEHDRNHGHRAGRDRCRADQRPRFEDGDYDRSPVILCLVREAPACHTHSESPFGPQQVVFSYQREVLAFWRPAIIWSSCLKVYLNPVFPPGGPRFDGGLASKLKDRPYRPGRSPHWKEQETGSIRRSAG